MQNLHAIPAQSVFSWLKVLCKINESHALRKAQFENHDAIAAKISKLNQSAKKSAAMANNETASKFNEPKSKDRHGSDEKCKIIRQ